MTFFLESSRSAHLRDFPKRGKLNKCKLGPRSAVLKLYGWSHVNRVACQDAKLSRNTKFSRTFHAPLRNDNDTITVLRNYPYSHPVADVDLVGGVGVELEVLGEDLHGDGALQEGLAQVGAGPDGEVAETVAREGLPDLIIGEQKLKNVSRISAATERFNSVGGSF